MQLKKKREMMVKNIEKEWEEQEKERLEEEDRKLREKLINEYEKKMSNAKVIKDQHLEYKMNVIKRIQEEQLEGELIRRQVDDEINKEH